MINDLLIKNNKNKTNFYDFTWIVYSKAYAFGWTDE
jgi:hypothetical protein